MKEDSNRKYNNVKLEKKEIPKLNFFKIFEIENYRVSLLSLIHTINICTVIFIYLFNTFLINKLINEVSDHYFNKYIIEPISSEFESINQEMSTNLRVQEDIILESKMNNFKIYNEFYFSENDDCKN